MNQDEIKEKNLRDEIEIKQFKVTMLESQSSRIMISFEDYKTNSKEYFAALDILIRLEEVIRINKRLLYFDKQKLKQLIA